MSSDIVKSLSVSCERLRNALACDGSICVSGPPSSGKTYLVRKVLEERPDYLHAYLKCELIPTSSKLYIEIFKSLLMNSGSKVTKNNVPKQLWSVSEFVDAFNELKKRVHKQGTKKIFVVLDRMEAFRRTAMIEGVMSLASLDGLTLIFITNGSIHCLLNMIRSASIRSVVGLNTVGNTIVLPDWSQDDIIESILQTKPRSDVDLYRKFVNNVVRVLYQNRTRDFVELRSFCQENFDAFLKFYKSTIEVRIRRYDKLNDDDVVDDELISQFEVPHSFISDIMGQFLASLRKDRKTSLRRWNEAIVDDRMEINVIMLFIACYIAAHTTPSDDKRNFVKAQRKKQSKRVAPIDNNQSSKIFSLERLIHLHKALMHIYLGKSTDKTNSDDFADDISQTIQYLQELNCLIVVSGDGLDTDSRFKISGFITKEYIKKLADKVSWHNSESIAFVLDNITGLS